MSQASKAPEHHYIQIAHRNRWTVSIATDTSGHGHSIVAFPTKDKNSTEHVWFKFADGKDEVRCFGLASLHQAIGEVMNAPPPDGKWWPCMRCTDPMECGSWATCAAGDPDATAEIHNHMQATQPAGPSDG